MVFAVFQHPARSTCNYQKKYHRPQQNTNVPARKGSHNFEITNGKHMAPGTLNLTICGTKILLSKTFHGNTMKPQKRPRNERTTTVQRTCHGGREHEPLRHGTPEADHVISKSLSTPVHSSHIRDPSRKPCTLDNERYRLRSLRSS